MIYILNINATGGNNFVEKIYKMIEIHLRKTEKPDQNRNLNKGINTNIFHVNHEDNREKKGQPQVNEKLRKLNYFVDNHANKNHYATGSTECFNNVIN